MRAERVVQARSGQVAPLERRPKRRHISANVGEQAIGLRARLPKGILALAPRAATLFLRQAQGLGRANLCRPSSRQDVGRLAFGLPDLGEGRLEGSLGLAQARPGVGDDLLGQPQSLRDRECLRPARQADREAIGRAEGLEVELDRRVRRARRRMGVRLQLGVMRRRRDERSRPDEVVEEGLGEGRPFGRVRARAELVEEHERAGSGRARRSG